MSASFLASVLIFCVGGVISLIRYCQGSHITGSPVLDAMVAAIIFFSAVFFLYLELYAETNEQEIARLKNVSGAQWILRVINQTNLTLMWLWLNYGLIYCLSSLLAFYIIILAWDAVVLRTPEYKNLIAADTNNLSIVFHDVIGFGAMLSVGAFVYFFKVANPGFIANGGLAHADSLNRFLLLIIGFVVIIAIFVANVVVVARKAPVNIWALVSRDRRV